MVEEDLRYSNTLLYSSFNKGQNLSTASFIPKDLTISNYTKLFQETDFGNWFLNSLSIATLNALISVILILLTAWILSRFKFKGKKTGLLTLLVLSMFPSFLSMTAVYTLFIVLELFWTSSKEYGEAVAKAFEAQYGVPITVAQEGMGTVDKIALSGPSGEGADVFITGHDNFQKGLSSGVFMELEDAIVDNVKSKVAESGVKTVINDDKMYGIPVSIEVNCLFYNKDLVETPVTTLEEIMEGAKMFNDPANNKFYFLCTIGDAYYEFPFVASQGFGLDEYFDYYQHNIK